MTERDPIWDALKQHSKGKFDNDRKLFLKQAEETSDGNWTIHTEYHWSRTLNGKRLDYWPSRKKFQYEGHVMRGNVQHFMKKVSEGA